MGYLAATNERVYNGYNAAAQQKCLAHLRRHFLKLIKLPGQHNRAIGEEFVNLIDEAFRNYRQWQFSRDALSYNDWAQQFQTKVELTLNRWIEHARATAGNLLRNLHQKAASFFIDKNGQPLTMSTRKTQDLGVFLR